MLQNHPGYASLAYYTYVLLGCPDFRWPALARVTSVPYCALQAYCSDALPSVLIPTAGLPPERTTGVRSHALRNRAVSIAVLVRTARLPLSSWLADCSIERIANLRSYA